MIEQLEENPEAKIMLVNECKEKISILYENKQIDNSILGVISTLYDYDFKKLKADIVKSVIMGSCDLNYTTKERFQLLSLFIACRKSLDYTDFSYLLNEIDKIIDANKAGLPFV